MFSYVLRRLAATIPVMVIVAVLVFLMLRLTPSDPAAIIAGDNANAEQVAKIRGQLGLDRPMIEQFVIWSGKVLTGDFGESFFFKKTVAQLIGERIEPSLLTPIGGRRRTLMSGMVCPMFALSRSSRSLIVLILVSWLGVGCNLLKGDGAKAAPESGAMKTGDDGQPDERQSSPADGNHFAGQLAQSFPGHPTRRRRQIVDADNNQANAHDKRRPSENDESGGPGEVRLRLSAHGILRFGG